MTPYHSPAMRLLKRDGFVSMQITPDGDHAARYILTETDSEQVGALLSYFQEHISDGVELIDLRKTQKKTKDY